MGGMLDLYASLPHYAEHMWPIWQALDRPGRAWAPKAGCWWGDPLEAIPRAVPLMVAGYSDLQRHPHRRIVYVEHGAGQHYPGDERAATDPSYSGGRGHANVALYVCPSATVAARWQARYPHVATAVVGCPKLDPWHLGERAARRVDPTPTIAVTFHWDCRLIPETRSAFDHYRAALAACVARWQAQGWRVIGHAHPRAFGAVRRTWRQIRGVQVTPDAADVLDQADILVGDNTSLLYEFASLDRPVVALNAPWYRRDVHHGLRFWSHVPGIQIDSPDALVTFDPGAHLAADPGRLLRRAAVAEVYAHTDGYAHLRAAAAIRRTLGGPR